MSRFWRGIPGSLPCLLLFTWAIQLLESRLLSYFTFFSLAAILQGFFCSQFSHSACLLWNAIFFSYPSMSFGCSSYFPLRVLSPPSFPFYRILTNKTLKQLVQGKGNIYIYSPFTMQLHSLSRKKEKKRRNITECAVREKILPCSSFSEQKLSFSQFKKKAWKKFHTMQG